MGACLSGSSVAETLDGGGFVKYGEVEVVASRFRREKKAEVSWLWTKFGLMA